MRYGYARPAPGTWSAAREGWHRARRAEDIALDITAATEKMAAGEDPDAAFPAVPGQQCSWCDFRPSCPTGQAAAPPRDGVAEATTSRTTSFMLAGASRPAAICARLLEDIAPRAAARSPRGSRAPCGTRRAWRRALPGSISSAD